jgi:hypothetical protein
MGAVLISMWIPAIDGYLRMDSQEYWLIMTCIFSCCAGRPASQYKVLGII